MKIGILTFHNTNNYGASLQSYALFSYIHSLGYDVEIINYQNDKMNKDLERAYLAPQKGIYEKIKYHLYFGFYLKKRKDLFELFKNRMILSVPSIHLTTELSLISKNYSKIIVGSDQVWNYNITDDDYNFYLQFCENKQKISYAASFGLCEFDLLHKEKIINLLSDFNNISVRENEAQKFIESNLRLKIPVVVDPTLLLSKRNWKSLIKERIIKYPYILIYSFGLSDQMKYFADNLSKKNKIKIVHIDGSPKNILSNNWNSIRGIGPIEWVNLFYYADTIITNSFHGTVFSLNFEKDFYTELLKDNSKVNSRLISILQITKLNDRLLTSDNKNVEKKKIEYYKVNKILDVYKKNSYDFIREALLNDTN